MIFNQIYNKKVANCYFADWGTFGAQGDPRYYLRGYVTVYSNGYKTVMGGASQSGHDNIYAYLLDKNNDIIETFSETL